jgi:RNA polymerase sigma-70 factor (ECF subfamily)
MHVDEQVINGCIEQDRKAQFQLYRLSFAFMMRICYRYVNQRADAEPMVNTAFCKVLMSIERYDSSIPFGAWIKRITINTAIDEFRKTNRRVVLESFNSEYEGEILMGSADGLTEEHSAEALMNMVKELPDITREIFNLAAIDGYQHKEIAEMLKIGESASKWHLAKARKLLQLKLKASNQNEAITRDLSRR